ncbi:MAG TPA: aminotransferase class V-fold PLP-dependent enzyme [Gemmatimonadaceae bacterium]
MHPDPTLTALERDAERDAALPFLDLVAGYLVRMRAGDGPVSSPLTTDQIAERFREPLPLGGRPLTDVVARLETDVLGDANRLVHPMYMGHQVSAPLPAAVWTEMVIAALNQSVAVAEMSPSGTALETRVIRWMTERIGWDGARAGGTFTSGGTEATFTALLAARAAALPDAWDEGVGANPPAIVCGEHAHYSTTRAAAELGLGVKRAIAVPSRDWKMDPAALRDTLDRLADAGTPVMAVVATAGSTATGSFDDLEAIGELCERRGLWLHVDGAHGASALLSERHRPRLRGVQYARSVAWDAHKMMLMPLAAGMLLVRDERDLERAFAQRAPYLFHGEGEGEGEGEGGRARGWDQGTRSFLCSRRLDALKVWVALQRYGARGIAALYDHLAATACALHEAIVARSDFEAMHVPESNILCFRWIGDGTRDDETLDTLNRELRERYNRSGRGWITTTVLGGRRVLRVTIMNPRTTRSHVLRLLDGLAEVGGTVG